MIWKIVILFPTVSILFPSAIIHEQLTEFHSQKNLNLASLRITFYRIDKNSLVFPSWLSSSFLNNKFFTRHDITLLSNVLFYFLFFFIVKHCCFLQARKLYFLFPLFFFFCGHKLEFYLTSSALFFYHNVDYTVMCCCIFLHNGKWINIYIF